MVSREVAIKFENFSAWHHADQPPVLRNLNLEIYRNEIVLILGATGAGKSSLGLCLNGIIPHMQGKTEGSLRVNGIEVAEAKVAQLATHVGLLFQDIESQICNLYVKDEICFGPENLALDKPVIQQRLNDSLKRLELEHLQDKFVFGLSGGQKQKVALASVLSMEPDIIFMDEPTANLDPKASTEVFKFIKQLARDKTIIIVEHKVEYLASLANRIIVIHQGEAVFDGPPREIFEKHGKEIMNDMGIWIPQTTEIALGLREKGLQIDPLPLTTWEASEAFAALEFDGPEVIPSRRTPMGSEPLEAVIQVQNLTYRYDDGTPALNGVSLTINRGEVLAIVGPNGSGKTTLVKHFVGLLKPQEGQVIVNGLDTRTASTRQLTETVGFVFQHPEHQFVKDSVEEEIAFSLQVHGVPKEEIALRLPDTLERFGLKHLVKRHPFSLSGGEKRRLSVATMLIVRPRILILDEPTYAQDRANTQRLMQALFTNLTGTDQLVPPTIVLVTHDMRLVAEYATRVVALRAGQVYYDGPVDGLFSNHELSSAVNLEDPPVADLCRRLRAAGRDIPKEIISVSDFISSALVNPVAS